MSEKSNTDPTPARMVYETQIHIAKMRRNYRKAKLAGNVPETVVDNLGISVMDYYDLLRRYRNKANIKEDWHNEGIDQLEELAGETVVVENGGSGLGRTQSTEEIPAIKTIDAETLIEISYKLDDIASDLGFEAEVDVDLDDAEFEYSDLLENGDPNKGDKPEI